VIVVDTNLLVYLWVHGERTLIAEAVLGRDAAWAAPVLWRSEFRNVVVNLVRRAPPLWTAHFTWWPRPNG
jgi:predicted nucleic acid-binding protein